MACLNGPSRVSGWPWHEETGLIWQACVYIFMFDWGILLQKQLLEMVSGWWILGHRGSRGLGIISWTWLSGIADMLHKSKL